MTSEMWMGIVGGLGAAFVLVCPLAFVCWRRWRQLITQGQRVESARQQLMLQNTQARKQIEIQQAELAELRHQLALYASGAKEMPRFEPTAPQPEDDLLIGLQEAAPDRPADGFAQTQIALRGTR
ncbi:hypothetical protein HNQ51_001233 [Inhella inkyongensis]|uniref:Uncharacterized protein n=2 Tax=Inhella inkyongensis TaxID=392593 RepID=A0A840S625_9BURK|nr:hypothetical protein [Inhella inkyongensis]MBB5203940.1 hypothetical protein [Inhella inkyongensis]